MGCHYYCVRVPLSWTSERPAEPMYRDEYLHFGEGEGGAACLCTFPGNDGEALDPDRLRSLAFLGAGVVLARGQAIQGDGDSPNFLPDCLPEWLVREIHRLVPDQSVIRDCQPDRESGGEAPQMVAAGIACDDKSRRATAELRREVEDLEALVAWIKEDPSRLGGDGWAEQCWWEERRQAGRSETPSATRPMAELSSEALFTDRPKDRTCQGAGPASLDIEGEVRRERVLVTAVRVCEWAERYLVPLAPVEIGRVMTRAAINGNYFPIDRYRVLGTLAAADTGDHYTLIQLNRVPDGPVLIEVQRQGDRSGWIPVTEDLPEPHVRAHPLDAHPSSPGDRDK